MDINILLNIMQVIVSVIVIALVLVQQQESGFTRSNNTPHTRRGSEKLIYNLTAITGTIFVLISIINFAV